jgi:hypothetical protein
VMSSCAGTDTPGRAAAGGAAAARRSAAARGSAPAAAAAPRRRASLASAAAAVAAAVAASSVTTAVAFKVGRSRIRSGLRHYRINCRSGIWPPERSCVAEERFLSHGPRCKEPCRRRALPLARTPMRGARGLDSREPQPFGRAVEWAGRRAAGSRAGRTAGQTDRLTSASANRIAAASTVLLRTLPSLQRKHHSDLRDTVAK